MPIPIEGSRDTLNVEQGRRRLDAESKIALFDPQATPLATAISTIGREYVKDSDGRIAVSGVPLMKKVTIAPRFDWWEDALGNRKDAINNAGGYSASDTDIVVDNGAYFFKGSLVFVPRTGELMEVDTVTTNTLTVRRGVGSSGTGVALNDDDELLIVGSLYPEGAVSRAARSTLEVRKHNFTQIHRTAVEMTETATETEFYTEDDWKFQIKKSGVEHLKDLERILWFGKREEGVNVTNNPDGKPKRTTGGVFFFITTNVTNINGVLSEYDWNLWLEQALKNGSSMKYVFASPRVLSVVSGFAQSRLLTKLDDKIYGVTIHEYQSPHGLVKLIRQPLFDESVYYTGHAVALDLKNVKYRFLGSRDTKLIDGRQANDADSRKSEYLSEFGLQLMLEEEAAILKNVQA